MLAYHGKPELKSKLLAEIAKHAAADAIVQGSYGHEVDGTWRGCAIACSLRSLEKVKGRARSEDYSAEHHRYPTELGIPEELAHLEDRLFEGMSREKARGWPERFASAIKPGADLSLVWPRFAVWLLVDETDGVIRFAKREETRRAIRAVAALWERKIRGDEPTIEEWTTVRRSAYAAAYAAADAAYADAYAADAYAADAYAADAYAADAYAADAYAAYAAAAYADAADADAYAAYAYAAYAYADADAARIKHFERMADKLAELLEAA